MGDEDATLAGEMREIHQEAFLVAFCVHGTLTAAAAQIKQDRRVHYRWLKEDPTYPERFKTAKEAFADKLESEALRRAHDGVDRVRFSAGKILVRPDGTAWVEKEFSDTLLLAMLKAHRRELYGDRASLEHSGPDGGPIRQEVKADVSPEFVAAVLGHLREAGHADAAGDPAEPLDPGGPEEAEQ
jgi:hypothetical protein